MNKPRLLSVLSLLAAATALGACGSDDGNDEADLNAITDQQGQAISVLTPKSKVEERLGEPTLITQPTDDARGGCYFYPIQDRPLSTVRQYCFDGSDKVKLATVLDSPRQPEPPEGAAPGRAILIARADAICDTRYAELDVVTRQVGLTLDDLDRRETDETREEAADAISAFVSNLEDTHSDLAAFEAPEDERDAFTAYLESLESQAAVLERAETALRDGEDQRYDELGDEFNGLADAAKEQAEQYGFEVCSAATFG